MKHLAPVLTALALAGCAAAPITSPPVEMTFANPAAGAAVDTYDLVAVRTVAGQFTNRRTIEGASCDVFGAGYQASFTSPALLRLPLYRGRTSDARVVCRASVNGQTLQDAATIEAINQSAPENEGVTIRTGTSGTSVNAVISIRDRDRDRFDYPASKLLVLR